MSFESVIFEEKHNDFGSRLSIFQLDSNILKSNMINPNWHTSLELIYVKSGKLDLHIEGDAYLLETGEIAAVNMGKLHYGGPPAGEQCLIDVFLIELEEKLVWNNSLEGKFLWPLIQKNTEIIPVFRNGTESCRCIGACLQKMYEELDIMEEKTIYRRKIRTDNPLYELKAISMIYDLMFQIFSIDGLVIPVQNSDRTSHMHRKEDIRIILQYMEDHYQEEIRVEQLANLLFMGVDNFYKFFHAETGTSPIHFLHILRSRKASELLKKTDMTIAKVGELSGFNSVSYFTRTFKHIFGLTPSQYRKKTSNKVFQQKDFPVLNE